MKNIIERLKSIFLYFYIKKSRLFDEKFYLEENEDVKSLGINPLKHYVLNGDKEWRNPNEWLDNKYYKENNYDIVNKNMNGLYHFIKYGAREGRRPNKDADMYKIWCYIEGKKFGILKKIRAVISAYAIYKSREFDGSRYMAKNKDVDNMLKKSRFFRLRFSDKALFRNIGRILTSPIIHYSFYGIYEGRNPNTYFNTKFYMSEYTDLFKLKRLNPFEHYVKFGKNEGRKPNKLGEEYFFTWKDYTDKKIGDTHEFLKHKKIGAIICLNDDFNYNKSIIEMVCSQNLYNIEITIVGKTTKEEENEFKDICGKYSRICRFYGENEYDRGVYGANCDFIWVVKEIRDYGDFIFKACEIFQNEAVMAVCFGKDKTVPIYEEIKSGLFEKYCYNISDVVFRQPKRDGAYFENGMFKDNIVFTLFIINFCAGGLIAFTGGEKEGYGIIENNFDINNEHVFIFGKFIEVLRRIYLFSSKDIKKLYEYERTAYLSKYAKSIDSFTGIFSIEKIYSIKPLEPIIISIISFTHGGGEIMPIRLANELKKEGYCVSVHCYCLEEDERKVRKMLRSDIPVYKTDEKEDARAILKFTGVKIVNTHHQALQSFFSDVIKSDNVLKSVINHVGTSHGMYDIFDDNTLKEIFNTVNDGVDYWTYVADKNIIPFKKFYIYDDSKFIKIPNAMERPVINAVKRSDLNIDEDAFVFCIVSRALKQKGWIEGIEAVKIARKKTGLNIWLIIVGAGEVYDELKSKDNIPGFVVLTGFKDNPCDYFKASDMGLLPSYYKSESAPVCIIEAFMSGIPFLATNIGDVKNMMDCNGELAGGVVELENDKVNINSLADKMACFAVKGELYEKAKENAIRKSEFFDIKNIASLYVDVYSKKDIFEDKNQAGDCLDEINEENIFLSNSDRNTNSLKVSVIVPCYNHGKYLKKRLDSIYKQTYKNIEVYLLDDCSSDESVSILEEYANKYKDITKTIFNKENSGSVFKQWAKGIKEAKGDLCWIAESDDYCDYNFLEKTVTAFSDKSVLLSYCKYVFVQPDGFEDEKAFFNYVYRLSEEKWKKPYINNSEDEVINALGILNTIPNASGAVFRRNADLSIINDEKWLNMRICGDWVFYINLLKGGKIAYTTDTKSYFRFHYNNTGVMTYHKDIYYIEHEQTAEEIAKLYNVNEETIKKHYENVKNFYFNYMKGSQMDFNKLYDLGKVLGILKEKKKFVPNIIVDESKNKNDTLYNTVIVNPIIAAGRNIDASISEKVNNTGGNTGNIVFAEAMKQQIDYVKEIWIRASDCKKIKNVSAVIPASNFMREGNDNFINMCIKFLDESDFPVTMAGLGAQSSKKCPTPKKLVKALGPVKTRFFKMLSERAVSIGIRGEFTAQCLEEMGIYNYRIIGCPSAYKYLDGIYKPIKKPSSEKTLMSVTTGSTEETDILKLGMSEDSIWIMQMMTELPEMAFENKEGDDYGVNYRYPEINVERQELKKFMNKNARMFFRINDWNKYLSDEGFTFAYGSRFHGNMCALRNGIPALWLVHDSRTSELTNTLHLPCVDIKKVSEIKSIEDLIELCVYDEFYKNYAGLTENYVKFLNENKLNHKFLIKEKV